MGAAVFVLGASLDGAIPLLAAGDRMAAVLTARPLQNAGLALMAAGVLCAEVLRRSIGVPSFIVVPSAAPPRRIEVTHPPELATRMG